MRDATTLCGALVGHLVGDYLLQNDWMALNKKKTGDDLWLGRLTCSVHCALWTLVVCALAGWFSPLIIGLLFATHFAQDRTMLVSWWMDRIGQRQFRVGICAPWSAIVVDNVWHVVTIYAIWRFLT